MKKIFAVLSIVIILSSVSYATDYADYRDKQKEPTAAEVTFDILLVRPLGLTSMALGAAVFVVGLPFTLPTGTVGVAAKKLIAEPFKFTFTRPIGEIPEY